MGVAGEHLVAERKAVEGHDQGDAHLLAVGAMIAGIAALRLRVRFGLALEIGAGHIVEQHFVLHREQLSAALGQMRLQRRLVRQQVIERAIEPVLVDRSSPSCSRSQSAVRRYQSSAMCSSLDGSHNRAVTSTAAIFAQATRSLPAGKQSLAQLLEPHSTPQRQRQVHVAKLARALDADALQANRTPSNVRCRHRTAALASGAPISRRASARASSRPCSSSSPSCATVCWITRRPTRTLRTRRQ